MSPRVEQMMKEYIELGFRADHETFSDFSVYVRMA